MEIINVRDAKAQFSRILARAEAGEEVVLGRAGKPVAKIIPYRQAVVRRRFGGWRGRVWVSDDFDAPLPEAIARGFLGQG